MKENPVDEEERAKDIELFDGDEQMPFTPIQTNNPLQWNYLIIVGVIAMVVITIIMMVWYRNRNKKETGYQMLV